MCVLSNCPDSLCPIGTYQVSPLVIEIDIPTYKENELPEKLLSIKAIKPGSRNL